MKIKSMLMIITAAVFCAFLLSACGQENSDATSEAKVQTVADAKVVKVTVTGMTCEGCSNSIKSALAETNGVISSEVSLEQNTAEIKYDPSQCSPDDLVKKIESTGYVAALSE